MGEFDSCPLVYSSPGDNTMAGGTLVDAKTVLQIHINSRYALTFNLSHGNLVLNMFG